MNMHNVVRSLVQAVNLDILGTWRESNGYTVDAGGRQTPTYVDHTNVRMQVQAQSGRDIAHPSNTFISQQGVRRSVYVYDNYQAIDRPDVKGGDLLVFPEVPGGPDRVWLATVVFETWPDWCKVGVVMQTDDPT